MKCKKIQEQDKINLQLRNKKKVQELKEKGITLIALVVTIIILLILVGVTLSLALSDNGLINMADKAVSNYKASSEKETLSMYMLSSQLDKEKISIGKSLKDKNIKNSTDWNIVVTKEDNKPYGTGWNYIEKGTEIEGYGKVKESWLLNNETGEMIELKEGTYMTLSAGDMVAVKDSIILNIDSSIIDNNAKNDEKELEKQLGEGVDLINFNFNEESGPTSESFNFDGVDDIIKIPYNEETKVGDGITLEFYGQFTGIGNKYDKDNSETEANGRNVMNGFLQITSKKDPLGTNAIKFGVDMKNGRA